MMQVVGLMRATGASFNEVMQMPIDQGLMILHAYSVQEGANTYWAHDMKSDAIARRMIVDQGFKEELTWE